MLTLLQAVELVRHKNPRDVTAEQLEELRACLAANPSLASLLGGREAVEQYLAEAESAIAAPWVELPSPSSGAATSPAAVGEPADVKLRRPRPLLVTGLLFGGLVLVGGVLGMAFFGGDLAILLSAR